MDLRPVRLSVFLLLTLLSSTQLAAQVGTLQGTVSDSGGTTLPNVSVTVEGTGLRGATGANGGYEVRGVPAGTYTVRVRLIGFQSAAERVTIAGGDVVRQDFTLGRSTVQLAPIDVVVGSRARHTAAEELAVPVDIFPAEQLAQQGSTETSVILQAVSPSINFPRQSVTDAGDVVRPFTLRGLSPDHTLVLVNGWRRHQTALVNNFTYGMGAGLERRGSERDPGERPRPDRGPPRRGRGPVRLRRHRGRRESRDQGRRVHPVRERRRRPLYHRRLSGRRDDRERERRVGHPARARLAGRLRRVPRPAAHQPGLCRRLRGRRDRRDRLGGSDWPGGGEAQSRDPAKPPLGRRPGEGRADLRQLPDADQHGGHERGLRVRRLQPPRRQRQRVPPVRGHLRQLHPEPQLAGDLPAGLSSRPSTAPPPTIRRPAACAASCRAGTTSWARSSATTISTTTSTTP